MSYSFTLRSKSMLQIPYSGKFSLVHNLVEMDPDSFKEIFIFAEMNMWCSDHTPTSYGHAPHTNWRNDTEWQSKEASLCSNSLVFLLCGGLCNYESIKTAVIGKKTGSEGFSTADLDFDNFRASLTGSLVFCIYTCSSRLLLLYSDHLEGRQTNSFIQVLLS